METREAVAHSAYISNESLRVDHLGRLYIGILSACLLRSMSCLPSSRNIVTNNSIQRLARSAPFGMYMFSPTGEPKFVNDSYLDLLSMTRAELVEKAATGLAWRDTVYHEDVERLGKTWAIMGVSKAPTKVEYRVLTKSESPGEEQGWKWVEAISFPELDEEGRVITVMGWIYDISLRKLTEGLMAQRLEDALENKRASERFIVSSPFIN